MGMDKMSGTGFEGTGKGVSRAAAHDADIDALLEEVDKNEGRVPGTIDTGDEDAALVEELRRKADSDGSLH